MFKCCMQQSYEALERLAKLRDQGILTEEEFATQKSRILERLTIEAGPEKVQATAPWGANMAGVRRHPKLVVVGIAVAIGLAAAALVVRDIRSASLPTSRAANIVEKAEGELPSSGVQLPALLAFENPRSCEASEALQDILRQLAAAASGPSNSEVRIAGAPMALRPVVRRVAGVGGTIIISQLEIEGEWQGLKVSALRATESNDQRISGLQIRFADPAEQVRSVLVQAGFSLDDVGKARTANGDDDKRVVLGVEALTTGSALTCMYAKPSKAAELRARKDQES